MTTPTIRAEVAAAVRRVNVLYGQVPESSWPPVTGGSWHELECEINTAAAAGDRARALRAVEAWEHHAGDALSRHLLNAPLGVEAA